MDYKFIVAFGIFVCVLISLPFMAFSKPQLTAWRGKPEKVRSAIPKYLIVKKPEGRKSLIKLNQKPTGN